MKYKATETETKHSSVALPELFNTTKWPEFVKMLGKRWRNGIIGYLTTLRPETKLLVIYYENLKKDVR